jgi:hypothetical protein
LGGVIAAAMEDGLKIFWIAAAEGLLPDRQRHAAEKLLGHLDGTRDWRPITTAPFNHDVAARIAGPHGGHQVLPFPCRQTARGWINSDLGIRMDIDPVEWRIQH